MKYQKFFKLTKKEVTITITLALIMQYLLYLFYMASITCDIVGCGPTVGQGIIFTLYFILPILILSYVIVSVVLFIIDISKKKK